MKTKNQVRSIAAVLLASIALTVSGCTINIGGGQSEAEAEDIVSSDASTVGAASHDGESYFPELGNFQLTPGSTDVFNPCTEVPREFYEELGISGLEQLIEVETTPICSTTLDNGTIISISSLPFGLDLLEGDEAAEWSEMSDGAPIMLLASNPDDDSKCSVAVGTQRGTIMLSYDASGENGCRMAEHFLRTIFTKDGKDSYAG